MLHRRGKRRGYTDPFTDLVFNTLLGITFLLIITMLFINPENKEGKINIDELKVSKVAREEGASAIPVFPLEIRTLKLNIGRVVHKDYTKGKDGNPLVQVFDIGLAGKEFRNIKSARRLVAVVIVNAVGGTTIKGAKMYALAAFAGPAFLPVSVAGVLVSKDHADGEFRAAVPKALDAALEVLRNIGEIKSEDPQTGTIKASVDGREVAVKIISLDGSRVKMTVSARKLKLPKPAFAGGILYQIGQEITGTDTFTVQKQ